MTIQGLETVFNQDVKALYLALADHLAQAIDRGELKAGQQLPTQRELAKQLGVTTGTVTRAFQELGNRGLVSCEVGRGTFVRAFGGGGVRHDFGQSSGRSLIDMAYNLPPPLPGDVETQAFRAGFRALATAEDLVRTMHYHFPQTDPDARQLGCGWLRRCGLAAAPGELIVTAGAQNALFVALLCLCRPGDEVLCEALTYPSFRSAADALHLRVTGLAMDEEGVLPAAFEEACRRKPKLVYLVPTLQNPTTATMGPARRREIVAIARREGVALLEDDIHALLVSPGRAPLCAEYPEAGWYLASTDKLLAPALRICFVRVPDPHRPAVERLVQATQWMIPAVGLWLVKRWLEDGTVDRLVSARRREAAARLAMARESLVGFGARIPEGGYHLWLPLPPPWRGDAFRLRATEDGVAVTTAEAFAPGPGLPQAVRLCLGGPRDRPELAKALGIVRRILERGPADTRSVC